MNRHLIPAVLLLLLASVACSAVSPADGAATKTAVGQQERFSDAATISDTGAGIDANLPHKTALPSPLPTVDANATQAVLLQAVATANEQTNQLQKQLADQHLAALQVQAQIERAKADAAKYDAANRATSARETQTAVDLQAAIATQKQADAAAIAAQADLTRAQTEREQGAASNAGIMLMSAALLFIGYLMYRAMSRPHIEQVVNHTPDIVRPVIQTAPNTTTHRPLPVDPATFHRFLVYAVTGDALGKSSMESAGAWKSGKRDRAMHTAIMDYLILAGHIAEDKTGKQTMTPDGIIYWLDWMERYRPPPATSDAQNMAPALHGDALHGMEPGGESVPGDAIIKIDPADVRDFGAKLDDAKDKPDEM